jgi:hypothetical protein
VPDANKSANIFSSTNGFNERAHGRFDLDRKVRRMHIIQVDASLSITRDGHLPHLGWVIGDQDWVCIVRANGARKLAYQQSTATSAGRRHNCPMRGVSAAPAAGCAPDVGGRWEEAMIPPVNWHRWAELARIESRWRPAPQHPDCWAALNRRKALANYERQRSPTRRVRNCGSAGFCRTTSLPTDTLGGGRKNSRR